MIFLFRFDRLYINRRVEIFNFQELGTRGKVENSWDFSRIFESVENMDIKDEMFAKETQRRFIFAPSGYGKSCFCEFAIYQWSKGVVWNEYELVVLIKANRINRMASNELLITLLEQSIIFNNVQQRNLTLKYLESLASQNKLLIFVDGVDEIVNFPDEISEEVINKVAKDLILTKDDTSLDGFQVIVALLLGQLFRGVHLILTTRNETMKCLWELCLNQQLLFQAIKVLPFEEEDVFKYIHKIHHDKDQSADLCRNETCQRTILLLRSNYNLLKLCSNPSCCMIVGVNSEILSSEKIQNLSTTNLISRFMGNVLAEHARLNSGIKSLFHGLSTFYKETFKKISKIAFVMFSRGERIMKGTYKEKENACSECSSPDCEISLDSITFECENKLNALGLLSLEKDNFKNVTCAFGQEIGLLRDYFAAAYIICEDKRISDITKFISDNKKFGKAKEFAYLNNHFYDILPIIACMLFSTDIFTKSFLEMMDYKMLKNNLSKSHFYKDITKLTQSRIVINENDGIFQVHKSPSQFYGSKVARHLSRCAFESQEKCFNNLECSGRHHIGF